MLPTIIDSNNQCLKSGLSESFFIKDNKADGNCLFYSIAESIYGDDTLHLEIREVVSNFYNTFRANPELYKEGSLLYKIAFSILYDNIDDDNSIHSDVIGTEGVYANFTDMMICAFVFDINIIMFDYGIETLPKKRGKKHNLINISRHATKVEINNELGICTIYIRFINKNHFEAMIPKFSNDNLLNKYFINENNQEMLVKEYTFRDGNNEIFHGFYLVKNKITRKVEKMTEYEIVRLMSKI